MLLHPESTIAFKCVTWNVLDAPRPCTLVHLIFCTTYRLYEPVQLLVWRNFFKKKYYLVEFNLKFIFCVKFWDFLKTYAHFFVCLWRQIVKKGFSLDSQTGPNITAGWKRYFTIMKTQPGNRPRTSCRARALFVKIMKIFLMKCVQIKVANTDSFHQ